MQAVTAACIFLYQAAKRKLVMSRGLAGPARNDDVSCRGWCAAERQWNPALRQRKFVMNLFMLHRWRASHSGLWTLAYSVVVLLVYWHYRRHEKREHIILLWRESNYWLRIALILTASQCSIPGSSTIPTPCSIRVCSPHYSLHPLPQESPPFSGSNAWAPDSGK